MLTVCAAPLYNQRKKESGGRCGMLRRYAEQIMNLYNFIDGMMIVNADAKVEYFSTYRPDVNLLKEKNLIGRYLLDRKTDF